jgi:hypothetical protein
MVLVGFSLLEGMRLGQQGLVPCSLWPKGGGGEDWRIFNRQ